MSAVSLSVRGVEHAFHEGRQPALRQIELEAAPGSFTALVGPNGSGKSTLLRVLAGLLRPLRGEVALRCGDQSLTPAEAPRELVARWASFLPARAQVPPDYVSLEIVLMGRHPFGRGRLLEQSPDVALADAALARAGAADFRERECVELSSGERQRVLLARVLCQGVPLLLLDEPTSAQDLQHVQELFALFRELAHQEGRTVIVATHDLNAAARYADRLAVLSRGELVRCGAPAQVLDADLLGQVFGVTAVLGEEGGAPYAVPRGRVTP